MTIDDIEISFGKSILIEKSQRPEFLKLVNSLCKEVSGSFLHCIVSNTGWFTIIRYSQLKTDFNTDYCLLRIVLLKDLKDENTFLMRPIYLSNHLYDFSYKQIPHMRVELGIRLADSCPIICHKESLFLLLNAVLFEFGHIDMFEDFTYKVLLRDLSENPKIPFKFCDRPSMCKSLYDNAVEDGLGFYHTSLAMPDISDDNFVKLSKDVNNWKIKLTRTGRRAL